MVETTVLLKPRSEWRGDKEMIVEGIKTTIPFHQQLMRNEEFRKGNYTTKFLETFQLEE